MPARVAGVLVASYRFPATPPPVLRAYVQRPPEKQWGGPTYEMAQLMIITLPTGMENIKKQVRPALGFAPATLVSEENIKTGAPCVGNFPAISYQQEWKTLISARCVELWRTLTLPLLY